MIHEVAIHTKPNSCLCGLSRFFLCGFGLLLHAACGLVVDRTIFQPRSSEEFKGSFVGYAYDTVSRRVHLFEASRCSVQALLGRSDEHTLIARRDGDA
jgi:hypothetical protein